MKRDLAIRQFAGFAVTSLLGTLLHFLYEWTGGSVLAAPFSGVNESTWEHMKLLYFPLFLIALIQSRRFGEYRNYWCAKLIGTTAGLLLIPVMFYTYNGVFGKSPDFVNITIFFITAAVTFLLEYYLLKNGIPKCHRPKIAFAVICLYGILFAVFTFATPEIPLFLDPVTGTYGIPQ